MNKKIWALALAVLAFAGCEEEEKKVDPAFIPSGEYVSIDMGEDTRTSLSADNHVTWTAGDAVGMFCAETECANIRVDLPDKCNGEKSVVVVTPVQFNAAADKHTFYMYYPYRVITGATNGTTTVKARLRHQQTGLLRDEAFTMAKCEVLKPDAGKRWGRLRATFQNPFAYIRFCVKDTRADAPARTIHNVSMEAITALSTTEGNVTTVDPNTIQTDRTAVFGGVFTADLTKPEEKVTFDPNIVTNILYVNPAAKPKVINEVLSGNGGYDLNESILMLVNPANFGGTNKFFRITFSFSDGTVGYAIKSAKEFLPNRVYNYGFKYENLNFNTAATIRVWPWTEISNSITFD